MTMMKNVFWYFIYICLDHGNIEMDEYYHWIKIMLQTNSTNTAVKIHVYKAGILTVSFSIFFPLVLFLCSFGVFCPSLC